MEMGVIQLPDGQVIKKSNEDGYRYLATLEMDKMKEKELKQ